MDSIVQNNEDFNILYEEKYQEIMSYGQMKEAYLFYNQLNDKNNLSFRFYTECRIIGTEKKLSEARIALCIARFITRRNMMRFSNC